MSQLPLLALLGTGVLMVYAGLPKKQKSVKMPPKIENGQNWPFGMPAFQPGEEQWMEGHRQLPDPGPGGMDMHIVRAKDGERLKLECPAGTQPFIQQAIYRTLDGSVSQDVTPLVRGMEENQYTAGDVHVIEIPVGHSSLQIDPAQGRVKELVVALSCPSVQPFREWAD